jgi:hypothetical protein
MAGGAGGKDLQGIHPDFHVDLRDALQLIPIELEALARDVD